MERLYTTKQLKITRYEGEKRLKNGTLFRVERGCYSEVPPTREMELRALLIRRPDAVVAGLTAWKLHKGIPLEPDDEVCVIVGAGHRAPRGRGVRGIRTRLNMETVNVRGIPCVPLGETPADMMEEQLPVGYRNDLALKYMKRPGREAWHAIKKRVARRYRNSKKIRHRMQSIPGGANSKAEIKLAFGIMRMGYEVELNEKVRNMMVDLHILGTNVWVELDSYLYHDGPGNEETFYTDRAKQNLVVMEDQVVLRFVTHMGMTILEEEWMLEQIDRAVKGLPGTVWLGSSLADWVA